MKWLKSISILILLQSFQALFAQGWYRTYGGVEWDEATHACSTGDGGYIFCGNTWSFGSFPSNIYVVKIDSNGLEQWSNLYGGVGQETAYEIIQTADSGYVIVGWTEALSKPTGVDAYIFKIDASGTLAWEIVLPGEYRYEAISVIETSDGGFIVTGSNYLFSQGRMQSDVPLIKISSIGTIEWEQTIFLSQKGDVGNSIAPTLDGGWIIGSTRYFPSNPQVKAQFQLIKVNALGQLEWSKLYDHQGYNRASQALQTHDGGFILVGTRDSPNTGYDAILIKTDSLGNIEWQSTFGSPGDDYGYSVAFTQDGQYILSGSKWNPANNHTDMYLVKVDTSGNLVFENQFGGWDWEDAIYVDEADNGDFVLVGRTESFGNGSSDVFVVRTNDQGILSSRSWEAKDRQRIRTFNLKGQEEDTLKTNTLLIHIYNDGTVEKQIIVD